RPRGTVGNADHSVYIAWTIKKYSNCTLPSGERAALVTPQPSQLLKVRAPDHARVQASKQLLAWFLGACGTHREQHPFKYTGPYGTNPQQCDFALGNDQSLLALHGVSIFTADCGCQAIYLGGDPRIANGSGCEPMP